MHWTLRQSGAGPPHSANQPSTSAAFVTCAERAVRADGASTARGFDVRTGRDHLFHLRIRALDDVRRLSTLENLDATARSIGVELGHQPPQASVLVADKVLVGHDVRIVQRHVGRQPLIHGDFAEPPGDGPQESFLLDGEFRVAAVAQMKALAVQTLPIRRVREVESRGLAAFKTLADIFQVAVEHPH